MKSLLSRDSAIGSWITLGDPSVAEIMAQAGFDWLVVDMEHSALTLYRVQQLVQIIELAGCIPLVRVGENNANLIKRVMDTGAHGVIVPMVNSKEEAERAVSAVKYPPFGSRGVGLARAQGYGTNFDSYRQWVNAESVVIVQIEHIDAVENLENILSVQGVDAFLVGPYDLSGSLGIPGQFNHPDMEQALTRIQEVSSTLGAVSGIHVISPSPEQVMEQFNRGYRLIAYSLDVLILASSCQSGLKAIKDWKRTYQ